jgi:type IV pilus assembly protein PilB
MLDLGFITQEQLDALLDEQTRRRGELLGRIAIATGLINEEQLAQALAKQLHMQVVKLSDLVLPTEVIAQITEPMAQLYRVIPIDFRDNTITIAMCDPQKLTIVDELRTFLGFNVRTVIATEKDVLKALDKYYSGGGESIETLIADMEHDADLTQALGAMNEGAIDLAKIEAMADSAPVRKLLNMVLLMGIKDHASDLHFEPFETEFKIRIRADGVLYEMVPPPRHLALALTTRIKVMANLDIAERRLPQDGRIRLNVGGHPVDIRVSLLPTMFGESAVLRVLDRSVVMLDLNTVMGSDPNILTAFRKVINKPNGIVLVTGPTGSGKTTTLYGALNELNRIEDKLITTEDPVEYDMDGITQIPIDASIGNTFAQCLRSILRQDPDKILVGEIRDLETAEIAVQSALTGHMVFSTLHTNDAPSTVTRLRDMGIPPFLITATLEAVLAQRLVRKICSECREEIAPTAEALTQLDLTPDDLEGRKFYRGRGCTNCNGSGYRGRAALFEFMLLNDRLRALVNEGASTEKLRDCALETGMMTLRASGLQKMFGGITTVEEVVRETVLQA